MQDCITVRPAGAPQPGPGTRPRAVAVRTDRQRYARTGNDTHVPASVRPIRRYVITPNINRQLQPYCLHLIQAFATLLGRLTGAGSRRVARRGRRKGRLALSTAVVDATRVNGPVGEDHPSLRAGRFDVSSRLPLVQPEAVCYTVGQADVRALADTGIRGRKESQSVLFRINIPCYWRQRSGQQ